METLTQVILKERLHYCPDTGLFTRLIKVPGTRGNIGEVVGSKHSSREKAYLVTRINAKTYKLHRLAFLYMTGKFPLDQVDHIDGNRSDNRWNNLRVVTNSENCKNQRLRSTNTTGVIGVSSHKSSGKYAATINHNNKQLHLGYFVTLEEAAQARKEAEAKYGYHPNHGQIRPL